jgi:hypothetical protein
MKISRPLKQIFWIIGGALTALAASIVLLVAYFIFLLAGEEPSKDEVARNVSSTGKVDAVLLETNGGATTSFGYEVYVVEHDTQPSGSPAISLYGAVRNQHAYGANLKWTSPDSVAVEFLSAESMKIKKPILSVGTQAIHLVVHEGVLDNAAPPGGMLYNLRGRQHEKRR